MQCTWKIQGKPKRKKLEDVNAVLIEKLEDAHGKLEKDCEARSIAAAAILEKPTDEDELVTPVVDGLDKEYYELTLKGVTETSKIIESKKDSRRKVVGSVVGGALGIAGMLAGIAYLDSCEKDEENPTQPMRHPGARLLKTKF